MLSETELQKKLQDSAYYGGKHLTKTDISKHFKPQYLKLIGQGMNARAFRLQDSPWVIKEGRWDLDLKFISNLNIELPAQVTQDFLEKFNFSFLPKPAEIKRQYQLYLIFCNYFGYFDQDSKYFHPNKSKIFKKQQQIRSKLISGKKYIQSKFWLNLPKNIDAIFKTPHLHHNFVPLEYTLYTQSFSTQNMNNPTYLIFQEFIQGKELHDVSFDQLTKDQAHQLALFAYLTLYMRYKENLVIDLRPRNAILENYDWFGKTDNVVISDKGVTMIDTRWAWNVKDSVVKRGGIIPEQIIISTRNFLNKVLKSKHFK